MGAKPRTAYWSAHRRKCMEEGRCHKCKGHVPIYKWGLCYDHWAANIDRSVKRNRELNKSKKRSRCSYCHKRGHNRRRCPKLGLALRAGKDPQC